MLEKYLVWINRYPKSVLAVILLITALFVSQLSKLSKDTTSLLLYKQHPSRVQYTKLRQIYTGNKDTAIVAVVTSDTVFKPEVIERIEQLSKAFEHMNLAGEKEFQQLKAIGLINEIKLHKQIESILENGLEKKDVDGIKRLIYELGKQGLSNKKSEKFLADLIIKLDPVVEVRSLSNIENIVSDADGLQVKPLMKKLPKSEEEMSRFINEAMDNEMFIGSLVSKDGKAAGIHVELKISEDDSENQRLVYKYINLWLDRMPSSEKYYLSGTPMISTQMTEVIDHDMSIYFPLGLLGSILFLYFTFRRLYAVILLLSVIGIALLWIFGIMAIMDIPQNIITSVLPVFIIAIGTGDIIQIIYSFYKKQELMYSSEANIKATFQELGAPVITASITTSLGFLTLFSTNIVYLRNFGFMVAIGIFISSVILSLTLLPVLLKLYSGKPSLSQFKANSSSNAKTTFLTTLLLRIGQLAFSYPRIVLLGAVILIILSFYWYTKLPVDNQAIGYFRPYSPIRIADQEINRHLGGTIPFNILLITDKIDSLKEPENIQFLADMEKYLRNFPEVGHTYSLADFIKRINLVMHDNNPEYNRIPYNFETVNQRNPGKIVEGRKVISQYLFLYESSGGQDIRDVIDPEYRQANISVALKTDKVTFTTKLMKQIENYVSEHGQGRFHVQFSGYAEVLVAATQNIVEGQMNSFGSSVFLILIVISLLSRSFHLGLIIWLPLLMSTLLGFAFMYIFKITINVGTSIVASVTLGIVDDFAIHYLARLRQEVIAIGNIKEALEKTTVSVGVPIVYDAISISTLFSLLLLSSYQAIIHLGWMMIETMVIGALSTFFLIPAVLGSLSPKWQDRFLNVPHAGE